MRISSLASDHEHLFQDAKNFANEIKTPSEGSIAELRTIQEQVFDISAQVDSLERVIKSSTCDKFVYDRLNASLSGYRLNKLLYHDAMKKQMKIAIEKLEGAKLDKESELYEVRSTKWKDTMRILNEQLLIQDKKAEKIIRKH
jgi:hypothetical protein